MAAAQSEVRTHRDFIVEPSSRRVDAARYGASLAIVAVLTVGCAAWIGASPAQQDASEVDNAVLVDLPPAVASARPASEAAAQPPAVAAQPVERHDDPMTPVAEPAPAATPDARAAPAAPAPAAESGNEETQPHASAHAITVWQKSLMRRLEAAKRLHRRETYMPGTAVVAFEINATGALASERLVRSSGSATLDKIALLLVQQATPFPAPPPGSRPLDMSFTVPIHFR